MPEKNFEYLKNYENNFRNFLTNCLYGKIRGNDFDKKYKIAYEYYSRLVNKCSLIPELPPKIPSGIDEKDIREELNFLEETLLGLWVIIAECKIKSNNSIKN